MTEKTKEMSWEIPHYHIHNRGTVWYFFASIIAIAMIVYAIVTVNYFFALIIVIGAILVIMNDRDQIRHLEFRMNGDGIYIGYKFYDYDEFKDFSVLYKPDENIKSLYFEYKNRAKRRISIPLEEMNPLKVREFLLRYLAEDLDRVNEPLSEQLTKFFKL